MDGNYSLEKWKRIAFDEAISETEAYLISTYGRVKSLRVDKINGIIAKLSAFQGYERIAVLQKTNKRTARYVHKLMAQMFIPKTNEDQLYVIHLDYDKSNNMLFNLKWATHKEKEKHRLINPKYDHPSKKRGNHKLTEGMVKVLKKKMLDPNRRTRIRVLAKQFGVSEMQLHRIKTGENWGYVTVD